HSVGDDAGVRHAKRTGPVEVLDDLRDGLRDGFRRGGLRCQQLVSLTDQLSCLEVDNAALDAAAAHIDAESVKMRACCAVGFDDGRVGGGHEHSSTRRATVDATQPY